MTLVGRLQKCFFLLLLRFYLFIFRERGKEGEREGEKQQCVVASCAPPTGDLARNRGMCPTGSQTSYLHKPALNPLSHTSQGCSNVSSPATRTARTKVAESVRCGWFVPFCIHSCSGCCWELRVFPMSHEPGTAPIASACIS